MSVCSYCTACFVYLASKDEADNKNSGSMTDPNSHISRWQIGVSTFRLFTEWVWQLDWPLIDDWLMINGLTVEPTPRGHRANLWRILKLSHWDANMWTNSISALKAVNFKHTILSYTPDQLLITVLSDSERSDSDMKCVCRHMCMTWYL